MTLNNFPIFQTPISQWRGGWVSPFVSAAHKSWAISLPTQRRFEAISLPIHRGSLEAISGKIECGHSRLIILNIYRTPSPTTTFVSELQDILSYISTLPHVLAPMGYFNLCIDSSSADAGQLSGNICSLSISINTLPSLPTFTVILLILWSVGCKVLFVSTSAVILDHFSVVANLPIPSNHSWTVLQTIKYRMLLSIKIEAFKAVSTILKWLDIPKLLQLDWLNKMTVSSALWSIFMPRWLPERSPESLPTHGWLLSS